MESMKSEDKLSVVLYGQDAILIEDNKKLHSD